MTVTHLGFVSDLLEKVGFPFSLECSRGALNCPLIASRISQQVLVFLPVIPENGLVPCLRNTKPKSSLPLEADWASNCLGTPLASVVWKGTLPQNMEAPIMVVGTHFLHFGLIVV